MYIHACIHTYIHTVAYIHTYIRTCIDTHRYIHTSTLTHPHTHTHTHQPTNPHTQLSIKRQKLAAMTQLDLIGTFFLNPEP